MSLCVRAAELSPPLLHILSHRRLTVRASACLCVSLCICVCGGVYVRAPDSVRVAVSLCALYGEQDEDLERESDRESELSPPASSLSLATANTSATSATSTDGAILRCVQPNTSVPLLRRVLLLLLLHVVVEIMHWA